MVHWLKRSMITVLLAVTIACSGGGGGGPSTPPIAGCSVTEQNQFIIDLMRDIYYWVDELPATINAADYASPEELMDAVIFTQLDRFSGIRDAAENDAFFSDSQFIGVGITLSFQDTDRVFLAQVFGDGPAAAAGLERGYEILEVNGRTVVDIIAAGDNVSDEFGPDEVGVNVDLRYRDPAGNEADVSFAKALVTIETVTLRSIIQVNGQNTGYLVFRNFVEPSFDALREAFAFFQQQGVNDVILDLRYNGGGFISVAEFLGGLLGGQVTDNQIFAKRVHNNANANLDVNTTFADETDAVDLTRLVVITAGGTASASELVINGLRPFLDVKLVGEPTFGKPVGSYQFDFCDKTAVPIAFSNFNALDEGDYFDGFAVDCEATDELSEPLGSTEEDMLAEAIVLLGTGACSPAAAAAKAQQNKHFQKHQAQRRALSEFQQMIMAE